jgi:3-oxoacyl-[acyl-carrier protein] reductase
LDEAVTATPSRGRGEPDVPEPDAPAEDVPEPGVAGPDVAHAGDRLRGRAAIVTGGARGIGFGIAARLVAEGARVALLDVDAGGAAEAAARLGAPAGAAGAVGDGNVEVDAAVAIGVDLGDVDAVAPAVSRAVEQLGRLDVLVNNAGIFAKVPLRDLSVAEWDRMLAVNARAVLLTMQAALAHLERSPAGRVVNVASMAARRGTPGEAHYAASKAAVLALTRVAALELGPCGITVNAVCPGYVLTDLGAATRTGDQVAAWSAASPLGRLAGVGDVAAAVAFLASDDAAYLTGQALDVSGGMVML